MAARNTRVLLIEDDRTDAELVRRRLADSAGRAHLLSLEHASDLEHGLNLLRKGRPDVVLLDLHLPDSGGVDTVRRVREQDPEIPIVVFTAAGDEQTALEVLHAGAQDYLVKDELVSGSLLRRSIRYAIERRGIEQENRRLQEQLRHAEKLESLGVLGAGAGFAFNQLMGTILEKVDSAIAALSTNGPEDGVSPDLFEVRKAAFRAAEMAGQLRDYAAAERGQREKIVLSELVLALSDFLQGMVSGRIEISYDLPGKLPSVEADPLQLRQLLVALVINASEAIGREEGSISIETLATVADRDLLRDAWGCLELEGRSCVGVRVRDSGRGMDEATRQRVFDPFFTTKLPGRGLGLSGVLGVVRRHGGAIHIESAPSSGTSVFVLLPTVE